MVRRRVAANGLAAALLAVTASAGAAAITEAPRLPQSDVAVERVAGGLSNPWGIAFLPDGFFLVTERAGGLTLFSPDGAVATPVSGVPAVAASGQGGLLDVALDPAFASNRLVYLSFAEAGPGGAGTAVARGRLVEGEGAARLADTAVIFRMEPKTGGGRHFGSRLVFAPDGALFVTLGDRGRRPEAQDPSNHIGSLVRIRPDGTVPPDNPFAGDPARRAEIFSYGHRNIQGADIDPATGRIVTVEHGARGGDEINMPEAGRNYGWPTISYGRHYAGGRIGEGTRKAGLEQPLYYWDPSIAPSGLAVYDGALFPAWRGDLLVGALRGEMLVRLDRRGGAVTGEERLLEGEIGRVRDVEVGPDGAVYLLTDAGDGGVWRLAPPGR